MAGFPGLLEGLEVSPGFLLGVQESRPFAQPSAIRPPTKAPSPPSNTSRIALSLAYKFSWGRKVSAMYTGSHAVIVLCVPGVEGGEGLEEGGVA